MAKHVQTVSLAIEEAHAALAILLSALTEAMHPDDSKDLRALVNRARGALDKACLRLSDARQAAQDGIDQL